LGAIFETLCIAVYNRNISQFNLSVLNFLLVTSFCCFFCLLDQTNTLVRILDRFVFEKYTGRLKKSPSSQSGVIILGSIYNFRPSLYRSSAIQWTHQLVGRLFSEGMWQNQYELSGADLRRWPEPLLLTSRRYYITILHFNIEREGPDPALIQKRTLESRPLNWFQPDFHAKGRPCTGVCKKKAR
jgi:hypothetical protein